MRKTNNQARIITLVAGLIVLTVTPIHAQNISDASDGSSPSQNDMASLVAYYTGHSSDLTDSLVASGKTVWRNSASLTGSYALRVHSGQYMNIGLSYIHGPAITPRVSDAFTFSASYSVFF